MKKNIGNPLALYPTPLVVVGAMVDGKPNWLLVGHVGILGHDHVMVSLSSAHYTNKGIKREQKALHQPCGRGAAAPGGQNGLRQRQQGG